MPPSSMSTLVLMVRLLVMSAARVAGGAGERGALDLDLELHQRAAFVDLRRDLEDGADFLALHGGERIHVPPPLPLPVLVYWPVMNGTSCATLSSRFLVVHGHARTASRSGWCSSRPASREAWRRSSRRWPRCGRCRRWCPAAMRRPAPDGIVDGQRRADARFTPPTGEMKRAQRECACRRPRTTPPSSRRARRSCSPARRR